MPCNSYEVFPPGMFCQGSTKQDDGEYVHQKETPRDRLTVIIHAVRTTGTDKFGETSSVVLYCAKCCPICGLDAQRERLKLEKEKVDGAKYPRSVQAG